MDREAVASTSGSSLFRLTQAVDLDGEVFGAAENFEAVNAYGRGVLAGCMLLGRLEIFTALVLLSPGFWKR